MGLIRRAIGGAAAARALGEAAEGVAEVFVPNATRRMELSAEAHRAALDSHSEEFQYVRPGLFDRFVNGLNRLPRPMLALGTLGLFIYAMIDPLSFAERMVGLAEVPEPLWWLLGAIVSFYFGARELHYFRSPRAPEPSPGPVPRPVRDENPALSAWRNDAARRQR
ncbi:holin family protein [Boseongicola sp. H5]|uniref:holin family protein n=1 Tax=Rhodobacterales TaxID=204455 RepID=UPI001B1FC1BA|nr:holin family protein [Boseongicola sp. H5]MBO6603870.1 holin family protein [Roseicyclus sp.]MBO6626561.1 holin family protein [Roseicyclus sp.]MBO6922344.1 holin family protein [Roseicyclus sp.]